MSSEPPSSPFLALAGFDDGVVEEEDEDECLRSFLAALVSSAGGGTTAAAAGGGTAAASALSSGTNRLAVLSVDTVRSNDLKPASFTCTSKDGAPFFTVSVSGVTPSSVLP